MHVSWTGPVLISSSGKTPAFLRKNSLTKGKKHGNSILMRCPTKFPKVFFTSLFSYLSSRPSDSARVQSKFQQSWRNSCSSYNSIHGLKIRLFPLSSSGTNSLQTIEPADLIQFSHLSSALIFNRIIRVKQLFKWCEVRSCFCFH